MAVERGEIRRLMISAPPRHGKTQLVSKRFPLWYLGRNPNTQIIHCGYGGTIAEDAGYAISGTSRTTTATVTCSRTARF